MDDPQSPPNTLMLEHIHQPQQGMQLPIHPQLQLSHQEDPLEMNKVDHFATYVNNQVTSKLTAPTIPKRK